MRELIKCEFAGFREDILSGIRTELSDMRSDISLLSEGVRQLEENPTNTSDQPVFCPPVPEDVIEELIDREARTRNIIIFGIPKPQNLTPEHARSADAEEVRALLCGICPLGI